jgi:YidC/Oxa1 family membrane protein insertase
MDKRNLIFILLFTLALFGINQFFSPKPAAPKEQTVIAEEKVESKPQVASLKTFPITEIYKDASGKEFLMLALNFGHSFLTTSDTGSLPKKAFAKKGSRLVQIDLCYQDDSGLTYYSTSIEEPLMTAYLPQVGRIQLQLISLVGGNPTVATGYYQNSKLSFAVDSIQTSAIALYAADSGYIPIGFFDAKSTQFSLLTQYPELEPILGFKTLTAPSSMDTKEQLFVIENDYQQIVFSNIGGAIAEINLPFESKTNTKSIVKEIQYDRVIEKDYTKNASFPLKAYLTVDQAGQQQKKQPQKGGYYPLLRRDLLSMKGEQTSNIPHRLYATALISEDLEEDSAVYRVKRFTSNLIEFESMESGRRVTKTYSFPDNNTNAPYCINLTVRVDGDARGLWLTSGVPEVELISKNFTPALKYREQKNNKVSVEKISLPKASSTVSSLSPFWISNGNGFFGIIIDPLSDVGAGFKASMVPGNLAPTRLSLIDSQYDLYPSSKYPGYETLLPLKKSSNSVDFRIYAGPFEDDILKIVDATYAQTTGINPQYTAAQTFHGFFSFISEPFARFLFLILKVLYSFTHSWGISIILLTIVLRILMYPLNAWSFKSTARMQLLAPKIAKLQAKYKTDPKKLQMETMRFYRENKANPFSGCIPLLIQMPFLFGMFDLLKSTFELRGDTFIPGWINDLAAPDVIFSWDYPIFFIGNSFHFLPILLGAIMFLQQKISSRGKVVEMTEQQQQQQKMGSIMTIVFTFMFYNFPAGLNLYWISSSLLGILQQWYTNKSVKLEPVAIKK